MKLLHAETTQAMRLDVMKQALACIAVRVPVTFKFHPPQSSIERELVTDHLRILLYASTHFSKIVSTSASEPLDAEAACDTSVYHRWSGGAPAHPLASPASLPSSITIFYTHLWTLVQRGSFSPLCFC